MKTRGMISSNRKDGFSDEMTDQEDGVYEVEEIKGHKFEKEHKFENGLGHFLFVKWANYDTPTWEPLVPKNFSNDVRATIKKYAQTNPILLQTQAWKEFFDYDEMSDDKDKEYEVEGIKGHKFENGSPSVFVKWANRDEETWEPLIAERYSGARSMIKKYAQTHIDLKQMQGWKDFFNNNGMTGTEACSEESRKRTYGKWKGDVSPGNAKTNLLPHYSTPPKRNRETIKNKVGRNSNNGSPRRSQNNPVHQYTERCDDRSKKKRKFDENFTNAVGSEGDNAVGGLGEHHNKDNNDPGESDKVNEDFENAFGRNGDEESEDDNNETDETDETDEDDNDDEFQNDPDEEEIPTLEKLDINDDTDNNWDGNVDLREGFLKDYVGSISTDIDSIYLIGRSLGSMLNKTTLGTEAYLGALMINRYVNMMPLQTTRHSIRIKLDDHTRSKKVPLHKFPGILLAMVDLGNPSIRFSINLSLVPRTLKNTIKRGSSGLPLSAEHSTVIFMALNLAKALHGDRYKYVLDRIFSYVKVDLDDDKKKSKETLKNQIETYIKSTGLCNRLEGVWISSDGHLFQSLHPSKVKQVKYSTTGESGLIFFQLFDWCLEMLTYLSFSEVEEPHVNDIKFICFGGEDRKHCNRQKIISSIFTRGDRLSELASQIEIQKCYHMHAAGVKHKLPIQQLVADAKFTEFQIQKFLDESKKAAMIKLQAYVRLDVDDDSVQVFADYGIVVRAMNKDLFICPQATVDPYKARKMVEIESEERTNNNSNDEQIQGTSSSSKERANRRISSKLHGEGSDESEEDEQSCEAYNHSDQEDQEDQDISVDENDEDYIDDEDKEDHDDQDDQEDQDSGVEFDENQPYSSWIDGIKRSKNLEVQCYELFYVPGMASVSSGKICHQWNEELSSLNAFKEEQSACVGHQFYVMGAKELKNSNVKGLNQLKKIPIYVTSTLSGTQDLFLSEKNRNDFEQLVGDLDEMDYITKIANCTENSLVLRIEPYYKIEQVKVSENETESSDSEQERNTMQRAFHVDAKTLLSIPVKVASRIKVYKNYLRLVGQSCKILRTVFSGDKCSKSLRLSPQAKALVVFAAEVLAYGPGTPTGPMYPGKFMRKVRSVLDIDNTNHALHIPCQIKCGLTVQLKSEESHLFGSLSVGLNPEFLQHPVHVKESIKQILDWDTTKVRQSLANLKCIPQINSSDMLETVQRAIIELDKSSFHYFSKGNDRKKLALTGIIEELCNVPQDINENRNTSVYSYRNVLKVLRALARVFWMSYFNVATEDLINFQVDKNLPIDVPRFVGSSLDARFHINTGTGRVTTISEC